MSRLSSPGEQKNSRRSAMKTPIKNFILLWMCAALAVMPVTASADDGYRSGHHEGFRRGSDRAASRFMAGRSARSQEFRVEYRREYHRDYRRRFHGRTFVDYYPKNYYYFPGVYCSSGYYGAGYPPVGTVYATLPSGCSTLVLNNVTIYTRDGVYYQYAPSGYVVVPPPC